MPRDVFALSGLLGLILALLSRWLIHYVPTMLFRVGSGCGRCHHLLTRHDLTLVPASFMCVTGVPSHILYHFMPLIAFMIYHVVPDI